MKVNLIRRKDKEYKKKKMETANLEPTATLLIYFAWLEKDIMVIPHENKTCTNIACDHK